MKKYIGNTLIILAILLVALVFSAEKSAPGDALYPFKRVVNEPLWSAVITLKNGDLQWKFMLLERRLNEIVVLLLRNELNRQESWFLVNEINKYDSQISDLINEPENQSETYSSLKPLVAYEIIMRAYSSAISQLVDDDRDIDGFQDIKSMLHDVTTRSVSKRISKESELIREENVVSPEVIVKLNEDVESRLLDNKEVIIDASGTIDDKTHTYALRRFSVAERSFNGASQAIENQDWVSAFAFLQKAYRVSEEAGLFVAIQKQVGAIKRSGASVPKSDEEKLQPSDAQNGDSDDAQNTEGETKTLQRTEDTEDKDLRGNVNIERVGE